MGLGTALTAQAETHVYPDLANTRGAKAHCFEAGVCLISGKLSNGQQCWVVETDANGNVVQSHWGSSWRGKDLLEKHVAEHCREKKKSEPYPVPTATPSPEPSPEPTHTPRPKPRPKNPKGGDDHE